jgi:alkaline phosphatase
MNLKKLKHKFLWNLTDFYSLKANEYDHILGLFAYNHLDFEIDRVEKMPIYQPSLIEMTQKAIEILSSNKNGFFLLVEGIYRIYL